MVTAGIFLLLRVATVLQWHLTVVGIFAGFTIVFGGMLAVLAPDIKQIIAYSTTSQLG
jgi:NADH:ubiquinone oxidoreductase subunit 5 (subunit L)/multisubunit Na+/H+ antiporter MnhA subunit